MVLRRVLYRLLWPAVVVLPLWVLLGRAAFGVPLGAQVLGQIVLVPLLFVAQAAAVGVVVARRSVRRARAVSWLDAGLLLLTWLAQLALGFFLVDSVAGSRPASAFTQLAGDGRVDLSTALFAVSAVLTILGGLGLAVAAVRQFVQEARGRVAASLADLDRLASGAAGPTPPHGGPASDDAPVITITPRS